MALVFIWILCVKQILVVVFYCALTCGSFVLERCSAVWRLGAGGFWSCRSYLYLLTVFTFVALFTLSFRGSGGLPV